MKIVEINDQTRLPLGFVISAVVSLAGGIFWITMLYADVAAAKRDLSKIEDRMEVLNRIEVRLSNVEGKIDILAEKK